MPTHSKQEPIAGGIRNCYAAAGRPGLFVLLDNNELWYAYENTSESWSWERIGAPPPLLAKPQP